MSNVEPSLDSLPVIYLFSSTHHSPSPLSSRSFMSGRVVAIQKIDNSDEGGPTRHRLQPESIPGLKQRSYVCGESTI